MTGLPAVHENSGLLRLIAQRPRQAAMIFMCVRKHDAPDVRNRDPRMPQSCSQNVDGFFSLGSGVDQGDGLVFDEIDVDGTDVERRGKGDGDDAHLQVFKCQTSISSDLRSEISEFKIGSEGSDLKSSLLRPSNIFCLDSL